MGEKSAKKSAKKSAAKYNKKFKKIPKTVGGYAHNNAKNGNKQFGFMHWIARRIAELLIWLRIMDVSVNSNNTSSDDGSQSYVGTHHSPPTSHPLATHQPPLAAHQSPGNNNTSSHDDSLSNIVKRLENQGFFF